MTALTSYKSKSPVLFIAFNRPDTTLRVFEKIREAKPSKLYFACDGARKNKIEDIELCKETRDIIRYVDWDCELKALYQEKNLGCKYAVSSAITWFFEHEEEGIILEDDCLPSNDFFRFCDIMLDKYRNDTRIRHITGCNLQYGKKWGPASYYFSNNVHVWGWACWKRVWIDYDVELSKYQQEEVEEQFSKIFNEPLLVESWKDIFQKLKRNEIDTWDYQLGITNFFNNGLGIIPNVNMISNIGFRADGTHTFTETDPNSNIPHQKLPDVILHPKYILPEKKADIFTWNNDFDIEGRQKSQLKRQGKLINKFKKWFR
ncbi:nucleotide-diphospho-sugar transferase [Arcticibacter tournemirensis]|uniref:Nucleotide-diphospho-sugar transferase n=1 Tax=Arcticibacter tournemirensis TaxID=699437 RepID=A0A4Q0M7R5_9SPHI|nr:nucleotide-diphospho-sugar transferase [Arcticibacter tournemirensis]RXF69094.1 nucleotide-diphospho-sugar transferase [Arcticibacter tournemirensis]